MSEPRDRVLSAREAARIIYNAPHPTDEQTNKVRAKIARGLLPASAKGHWTTTSGGVADYLAANVGRPPDPQAKSTGRGAQRPEADKNLSKFYRDLLKDYFLAVTLRRRSGGHTRTFDRAVLAGQIGTLLLGFALLGLGYRAGLRAAHSAEQVAVLSWLDGNVQSYKIVEWFPPVAFQDGAIIRVRYKYFENRKPIETDRRFLVRPGQPAEWYLAEE